MLVAALVLAALIAAAAPTKARPSPQLVELEVKDVIRLPEETPTR